MPVTVRELAELVQGEICGDGEREIRAARPLSEAGPGDITFVDDEKHFAVFQASRASAAILPSKLAFSCNTLIRVKEPLTAFITVFQKFHASPEPIFTGIHPSAQIHPTARIGEGTSIGPFVIIEEGCVIGKRCRLHPGVSIGHRSQIEDDVTLYPRVVLYKNSVIGKRVIIHANAVIGADGFGYRLVQGHHEKVPQLGHVEIGDDVEIGACTTIDRATFGATRIGQGTKIDNLVMIGHNCQIGRHNIIVSQAALAGSATTGDYVVIAGQAGVCGHVHVGDQASVAAKAGVTKDVQAGSRMIGYPAGPVKDQMRMKHSLDKIPEMRRDLKLIKQHLGLLEEVEVS
ncbi:MAG: UDP-3-O-(3-hydroxymyristoyl)glucosamine N-acyltransferase [Planctomycetes bacterium]|nr:UDP-3-O-(3-hydroxymyristoyl)glucosamine N-acyltransferase [Planctomycetota bacterium]